jgi:hypothetical protein
MVSLLPVTVRDQLKELLKGTDPSIPLSTRLDEAISFLSLKYSEQIKEISSAYDWEGWKESNESGPSAF